MKSKLISKLIQNNLKNDEHKIKFCLVLSCVFFSLLNTGLAEPDWAQVNDDGFFGNPPTSDPSQLFIFGSDLYAYDDYGLYRMQVEPCIKWEELFVPISPGDWGFQPIGNKLYLFGKNALYSIELGKEFIGSNWESVSQPYGLSILAPRASYGGYLYASSYSPGKSTFDIWRTPDPPILTKQWTKVVSEGFSDPQNHALGFMIPFNNKLIAVTTSTREGVFGDYNGFGKGIQVWESPTGDEGSWTKVSADGFGTEITLTGSTGLSKSIRTNQDVGGWAIYNGYLYIGTLSHFGAQIWRYDGSGLNGWTDVTPPWAGPCQSEMGIGCGPGRNSAMTVFDNKLYVAEGYPTANLASYDGYNWMVAVGGPNPFDPTNGGLGSIAVLDGKLYVSTLHAPYTGKPVRGDQVYGYPYTMSPKCTKKAKPDLRYDPPLIKWNVPDGNLNLVTKIDNVWDMPLDQDYMVDYYLDGELVHQEPGPRLGPGESREMVFDYRVDPGRHTLKAVIDPNNMIEEQSKDNNVYSFSFIVPEPSVQEGAPSWPETQQEGPGGVLPTEPHVPSGFVADERPGANLVVRGTGVMQRESIEPPPALVGEGLPDLAVGGIEPGTPTFRDNGMAADVPLTITLYNRGTVSSGPFKTSIHLVIGPEETTAIPFLVPGQDNSWYPLIDNMEGRSLRIINGSATITSPDGQPLYGKTLRLKAVVDSCSGDEFMPSYCRVQESKEDDNEFQIPLVLPQGGMVTTTPGRLLPIEPWIESSQISQVRLEPTLMPQMQQIISPVVSLEENTDRPGMNYKNYPLSSADPQLCSNDCVNDPNCKAFTYVRPEIRGPDSPPECWLKNDVPNPVSSDCCVSGVK